MFIILAIFFTILQSSIADDRIKCMSCQALVGLGQQAGLQLKLQTKLKSNCNDNKACIEVINKTIYKIENNHPPEEVCRDIGMCPKDGELFLILLIM